MADPTDKLLVVEPGRFRVIDGNYDTYQHLVRQGLAKDARASIAEPKTKAKPAAAPDSKEWPTKETRRKRKFPYRRLPEIEAEIAEREARLVGVDPLHLPAADQGVEAG